ncbi:cytochrome P450 [Mycena vulgaris]|nr:cytochrome P450 [Mycena vulgaris]
MSPIISMLGRNLALEFKPTSALLAVLGLYVLRRILTAIKLLRPMALPGLLLPTTSWTTGLSWHWIRRFQSYTRNETVNLVPVISGIPGLWTSNIDIARQVIAGGHKTSFIKPESASGVFLSFTKPQSLGHELVYGGKPGWRKHRRVVGPAFGTELYKMVRKQTAQTYRDMVEVEGWQTKDIVDVPVIQALTLKLAFLIISACGFGFPSPWATPETSGDGEISVQEALRLVAETNLLMLATPKWVLHLPIKKFTIARMAHDRIRKFMQEQVTERKAEVSAGNTRADAFTMLVKANQNESSKYQLDDQELIGNKLRHIRLPARSVFMAIHGDIQNEVLEQIISVVGTDREPQFEDYSKLDKVLAIFYESARMFPAGHVLIREATEDTVLIVPNPPGEEGSKTIPIPKGTQVRRHIERLQYNPRSFENPEMYKPSRWYGLPADSELFTAFSVGPRACIGRRFATVEATCFLALLLRDWRVMPILRDGESKEAWGARVLDAHIVITLGVGDMPLRFERRKHD